MVAGSCTGSMASGQNPDTARGSATVATEKARRHRRDGSHFWCHTPSLTSISQSNTKGLQIAVLSQLIRQSEQRQYKGDTIGCEGQNDFEKVGTTNTSMS